MSAAPLISGLTWEQDPQDYPFATEGRTERVWLRSTEQPVVHALFKAPATAAHKLHPFEMYSLGMERVAYVLAMTLGLPVPRVTLEEYGGRRGALSWRVSPETRDLRTASTCPMLANTVENEDLRPLAVLFDIWLANVDRKPANLMLEPRPEGARAKSASRSRLWLIDHGFCGLFPPNKFDASLQKQDPARVVVGDGRLLDDWDRAAKVVMPIDYRNSLQALGGEAQQKLLDRVRAIEDDQIDEVVNEIPADYFTGQQAERTAELLKVRKDQLDKLVQGHW